MKWDADGHRLPTRAEWKQAYKAGGPLAGDFGDATRPVGSGEADGLGLYDMRGNVWELVWTHGDSYDPEINLEIVALGGSFHGDENSGSFSASPYWPKVTRFAP